MILKKTRGFTLMELIVSIILMSILGVFVVSKFQGGMDVSPIAKQIAADIRYTQVLSMNRGQRFRIILSKNQYTIRDGRNKDFAHPSTGKTTTTLPNGVTISPSATIIFDTQGAAVSGSGVYLVTDGDVTKTITVYADTGAVVVS